MLAPALELYSQHSAATFDLAYIIELLGPPQQLDEPQQPDGAAAVLVATQTDGDLAADGKSMEPNEHWLVEGTLNVHGWN